MERPDYFLVDLPAEAECRPELVSAAAQTLKRNRELYLRDRPTRHTIADFCEVASRWLDPSYPLRQEALDLGAAKTGFSGPTLERGLDSWFQQINPASLDALIRQELGHSQRLDGFSAGDAERSGARMSLANGPELLVHFVAGNLPIPAFQSILLGLLARAAQFVKCASHAAALPRLFAHSIYEVSPKLGACLELAAWPGGDEPLESALFAEADCVTATGSDEALASIRRRLPPQVRFLGYGHRISFAFVAHEIARDPEAAAQTAHEAARDISAWDQQGCLSPHVIYVENGGRRLSEDFAGRLADAMACREQVEPRGPLSVSAAAAIAARRAFYEVRAAASPDTIIWFSPGSTAWTVVYEADPRFQPSCLNRFVYVKGVSDLVEALQAADSVRTCTSAVGLAAPAARQVPLATSIARWGATRICPIGQMQNPPISWRHDGRPALADLLTWSDWETPSTYAH